MGLVTGLCFAELGHEVLCIDSNAEKVSSLKAGRSPIYEHRVAELLQSTLKAKSISFSTHLNEAIQTSDIFFIAIGTPQDVDGAAELKSIREVAHAIAKTMGNHKTFVIKSTVPIGTCEILKKEIQDILKSRKASLTFDLISNPEFLREGNAVDDFMQPDRIIIGVDTDSARDIMSEIYHPLAKENKRIIFMDLKSSEMTKYASNAMLAAKISLMNELSRLCEKTGADIDQVKEGVASDHRIGPYFMDPGIGFGGSCFPKDLNALKKTAEQVGVKADMLAATQSSNQEQRHHFLRKIKEHFSGNLQGKKIALWGLSFKPYTDDIRNAPSLDLIEHLLREKAVVQATDPAAIAHVKNHFAGQTGLSFFEDPHAALEGADALVLLTEWPVFAAVDLKRAFSLMKNPALFDGRNLFRSKNPAALGFHYFPVGTSL